MKQIKNINPMKKWFFFSTLILFSVFVFSCKEDTEEGSKKALLTSKTWIVTSKPITPAVTMMGTTINDISALDPEAVKKYTYKYNDDGTMIQYDESNKVKFQTTWSFNSDETILTHNPGIVFTYPIVGNISLTEATIISLSANKMAASIPSTYEGVEYVVTLNFEAK